MKITLKYQPTPWQELGLQETAYGYGRKLTSAMVAVLPNGSIRRVYVTRWANAGTQWIMVAGKQVNLPDSVMHGDTFEI